VAGRRSSGPPRRRSASTSAQLPELLIFLEGARTEEGYFVHFWREHRSTVRIRIDPSKGSSPATLVDLAVREKKRQAREAKRSGGRAYDEIWCVFDVDQHPGLAQAIQRAREHDIEVAVSNPCFELWLILHHQDQTAHIERGSAQSLAKRLLGCGKILSSDALAALYESYDDARRRAEELDRKHLGDGSPARSNPSSEAWKLVQSMRRGGRR
jgi:RloB-like protein